jgi:hypothetical protein
MSMNRGVLFAHPASRQWRALTQKTNYLGWRGSMNANRGQSVAARTGVTRIQADRSWDFVCMNCLRNIGRAKTEEELESMEMVQLRQFYR